MTRLYLTEKDRVKHVKHINNNRNRTNNTKGVQTDKLGLEIDTIAGVVNSDNDWDSGDICINDRG